MHACDHTVQFQLSHACMRPQFSSSSVMHACVHSPVPAQSCMHASIVQFQLSHACMRPYSPAQSCMHASIQFSSSSVMHACVHSSVPAQSCMHASIVQSQLSHACMRPYSSVPAQSCMHASMVQSVYTIGANCSQTSGTVPKMIALSPSPQRGTDLSHKLGVPGHIHFCPYFRGVRNYHKIYGISSVILGKFMTCSYEETSHKLPKNCAECAIMLSGLN